MEKSKGSGLTRMSTETNTRASGRTAKDTATAGRYIRTGRRSRGNGFEGLKCPIHD